MTAVVVALSATAILGFAGLAVDVGIWYSDKRTLQGVVDLAANAAAVTDKAEGQTTASRTDAVAAAYAVAAVHGFANGVNGVTVTVNNSPLTGSHTTSADAFEVIITKPEPIFFSGQYMTAVSGSSRAVGAVQTTTQTTQTTSTVGGGCFVQLGSSSSDATTMGNGASLTLNGCSYFGNGTGTNSSGTCSLNMNTGGTITTSAVNLSGGYCTGGGAKIVNSSNQTVTPLTNVNTTPDPYGGLTLAQVENTSNYSMPQTCSTSGTASFQGYNTVTTSTGTYVPSGGAYTIKPGVYCGGITSGNNAVLTFSAGVYYIMGGTFTLGSGANIATAGVTIVLVNYNGSTPTLNMTNGASLNITAPTSGPTAGIAFYGDPANTGTVTFNGGFNLSLTGALYFPSSNIEWDNGAVIKATSGKCTEVVGNTFNIQGGLSLDMSGCTSANGVKQISSTITTTSTTTVATASVVE